MNTEIRTLTSKEVDAVAGGFLDRNRVNVAVGVVNITAANINDAVFGGHATQVIAVNQKVTA